VDVLTDHTIKAAKAEKVKTIALAGGVAANSLLRHQLEKRAKKAGFECVFPSLVLCTDNAAMIASAGYYSYLAGEYTDLTLNAIPYLQVGEGHKK
jgi:N6-L-threonylcarbamoyladenine synthase